MSLADQREDGLRGGLHTLPLCTPRSLPSLPSSPGVLGLPAGGGGLLQHSPADRMQRQHSAAHGLHAAAPVPRAGRLQAQLRPQLPLP